MAEADTGVGTGGVNLAASQILSAASREKADAFVDKQNELADLQIEDMKRENAIRHWSLRVRHISDVMKLGFELAVAFIVAAIAVGLGVVIWQAAHADGLVIESFDVPQDLAQKGLTGSVIANKLLDRLTVMQYETDSTRAPSSFANDWTNDIRVDIPDTGISLGQIVRFLDGWLGHQMHLSGELYETSSGVALTVRMDNEPGQTFEGNAGDLNSTVARAAEAVYARSQPYRYEVYLGSRYRFAEAFAASRRLAVAGPPEETAWADNSLAILSTNRGDTIRAQAFVRAGQAIDPNLPNFEMILTSVNAFASHDEAELDDERHSEALLRGKGAREWNPAAIQPTLSARESLEAQLRGDFAQALVTNVEAPGGGGEEQVVARDVFDAVSLHDITRARRGLAALDDMRAGPDPLNRTTADATARRGQLLLALEDWRGALAQFDYAAAARRKREAASKGWLSAALTANVLPFEAYAYAMLGEFDRADAILKTLPQDCDICMRYRGKVDAARRNWPAAARWFALVSARSPGIPFPDSDWGAMLMAKGDFDGAIVKFESAHAKGPHFADPLEMWGEALIAKNRSDLALAKFEEANKYAPNWGRLHLKWGEALIYAGKPDEAKKQFTIAATLDLSAADKAALAKMSALHG
jgi:tetratricopeptide (TPR) repeat protein